MLNGLEIKNYCASISDISCLALFAYKRKLTEIKLHLRMYNNLTLFFASYLAYNAIFILLNDEPSFLNGKFQPLTLFFPAGALVAYSVRFVFSLTIAYFTQAQADDISDCGPLV